MHIKTNQLMAFGNRQQLARIKKRNTKKLKERKILQREEATL